MRTHGFLWKLSNDFFFILEEFDEKERLRCIRRMSVGNHTGRLPIYILGSNVNLKKKTQKNNKKNPSYSIYGNWNIWKSGHVLMAIYGNVGLSLGPDMDKMDVSATCVCVY